MWLSFLLWCVSLCLPAFDVGGLDLRNETAAYWKDGHTSVAGSACLMMGIFGLASGLANLSWLANPILLASWMIHPKHAISMGIAALPAVLCLLPLVIGRVVVDDTSSPHPITHFHAGYGCWVLACWVNLASLLVSHRRTESPIGTNKTGSLDE